MLLKTDVIAKMAELVEDAKGTKTEATKWLKAFLDTIDFAVETGDSIKLNGYFSLEVVDTKERTGRNPATGEPIAIPAGRTTKMRPSKRLKDNA